MGFWKDWIQFLKNNAKKNMKRFSIAIGSFLFLIISSLAYPIDTLVVIFYAGAVELSGIIIMSLFGKNGNGSEHNQLESKIKTERVYITELKKPESESNSKVKETNSISR